MIYVLAAGRVIGIVFLVIAAIVVLILVIPVTYRLDANLDTMRVALRVGWMFRLFRFRFRIEEETEVILTILFFSIDFLDEERREIRKKRRQNRNGKRDRESEEEEVSIARRIIGFARAAARVMGQMREFELLSEVFPLLQLFLFRTRPRDIHGQICFGLRDPANTGMLIGAVSTIPAVYRTDLSVSPDFEAEENYIEGDVHAKGHLLLFHLLVLVIRLIRRENVRKFIGALRRRN